MNVSIEEYSIESIPFIAAVVSLITALILNRELIGRSFWRAVFFFPVLLSPVVVRLTQAYWAEKESPRAILARSALDVSSPTIGSAL